MNRSGCIVFFVFLATATVLAQNRPLATETASTVPDGWLRTEFGFAFLHDVTFRLSGLEGNLSRLGEIGLRLGAGERVELQAFWTPFEHLSIRHRFPAPNSGNLNFSGDSTNSVGDLQLATKFRFLDESEGRPALAFRFGVELPNSSNESGLGNDETDFFTALLIEKNLDRLRLIGNLGLAILGDPISAGSQDDLLTYGMAAVYTLTPDVALIGDFYGRAGAGGIGTEEQSLLRMGTQIKAAGLYWDAALMTGFEKTDPDFGVIFGISKDLHLGF